jgi:predicted DNA-binding protein
MKKKQPPKPPRKRRYLVYLTPAQIESLTKLRLTTGVPSAYFIRAAIDEALSKLAQ